MAHYSYKDVVYDIPQEYFERFEKLYGRECDKDPNYNGDYWTLVSWWIDDLQAQNSSLKDEMYQLRS